MEKINILDRMSTSLTQMLDHMTKKYPRRRWMYEAQHHYWESASQAWQKGLPVVWHNQGAAPELLYAMNVVPMCMDVLSASLAAQALASKYVDIAHEYVPEYICSVNKTAIGLAISGEIPKPEALIYTSAPCDSARISYPLIAEALSIPHYCIDTPFQENERGYEYIADELKGALAFLENVTGQRLDWSSMAEVIKHSNRAYALFEQIAELRKTAPCPLPGRLLAMNAVALGMIGSPHLVNFLEMQLKLGLEKVGEKKGWLAEEKRRVAWIQNPIFFDFGVMDWLEEEYGAVVIMDAFGFRKAAPIEDAQNRGEVFKGLAKRSLMTPMTHVGSSPVEYWMESTTEILGDYNCDTAIFAGHVGCTHNWAVGKLIRDMIFDRFGVTTLVFDVDALDPRFAGTDAIKNSIRDFMEAIG